MLMPVWVMHRVGRRLVPRVHLQQPGRQRLGPGHAVQEPGGGVRARDRDRDRRVEQREQHEEPAPAPVPLPEHERGQLRGAGESRQLVGTPARDLAPRDEDQEDAHDEDGAEHGPRDRPLRVAALLGQRRRRVPAGDREDREHDAEEQAVQVRPVEGVGNPVQVDAAGAGAGESGDRQRDDDEGLEDAEDDQQSHRQLDAAPGGPGHERRSGRS